MKNLKKSLLLSLVWYEGVTCATSMEGATIVEEGRIGGSFHSPGHGYSELKSGEIELKSGTPTLTHKKNIVLEEINKIEEECNSFIRTLEKYNYKGDIQKHRRVKECNNIINDLKEYQKNVGINDQEEEIKNKMRAIQKNYRPVDDK